MQNFLIITTLLLSSLANAGNLEQKFFNRYGESSVCSFSTYLRTESSETGSFTIASYMLKQLIETPQVGLFKYFKPTNVEIKNYHSFSLHYRGLNPENNVKLEFIQTEDGIYTLNPAVKAVGQLLQKVDNSNIYLRERRSQTDSFGTLEILEYSSETKKINATDLSLGMITINKHPTCR